jgi:hypothetical protein
LIDYLPSLKKLRRAGEDEDDDEDEKNGPYV